MMNPHLFFQFNFLVLNLGSDDEMIVAIDWTGRRRLFVRLTNSAYDLYDYFSPDIDESELNERLMGWHRHCFTWKSGENLEVIV